MVQHRIYTYLKIISLLMKISVRSKIISGNNLGVGALKETEEKRKELAPKSLNIAAMISSLVFCSLK